MTEPLNDISQIEDLDQDSLTEIVVHSVSTPIKNGFETAHDSWSVLVDGDEVFHDDYKDTAKERAREIAENQKPAGILFEKQGGEAYRAEVAR